MSIANNFGRVGIYKKGVPFHEVTRYFDHVVLQKHVNYFSCCITATIWPMTTKLGKMVTHYKKIQPIKSQTL